MFVECVVLGRNNQNYYITRYIINLEEVWFMIIIVYLSNFFFKGFFFYV